MKFYVTTVPGISPISVEELKQKFPKTIVVSKKTIRNNDIIVLDNVGEFQLNELRSIEDFFFYLGEIHLSGNRSDLDLMGSFWEGCEPLEFGLKAHKNVNGGRGKSKRTKFRVVVQADDVQWRKYRRVDIQKYSETAISDRYGRKWKLVDNDAHIEFWVQQIKSKLLFGIRLSDRTMRHRKYKLESIEASLKPTIAYAMAFLAGIDGNDVFVDPMCGVGTILIERALAGEYASILGGDIDLGAVSSAKMNAAGVDQNIGIQKWDARKLPIEDNSVDKIVTNLPWGRKIGSVEDNKKLYPVFFDEVLRVLKPGGRCVLLTSEWDLMKKVLDTMENLVMERQIRNIKIQGYRADIYVIEKRS